MRLMQIATYYPAYLTEFYGKHLGLMSKPSAAQVATLLDDGFGASHMIGPYMKDVGYDVEVVIANAIGAQTQWAMENGHKLPGSQADLLALTAKRIETFKPDILYLLDPILHESRFLAGLSHRPKLVVGWRAAPIAAGTDWTGFDLILSSDEGYRKLALKHGARHSTTFRPGFPRRVAEHVADTPKSADISFCGQITGEHTDRIKGLAVMAQYAAENGRSTDFRLGVRPQMNVPDSIRKLDRGAVWGMDMYRAVRAGRVTPNFHINAAVSRGQNMRLLEVTGVGSFMLTEDDPDLGQQFAVGSEVESYKTLPELLEKTTFYLDHENKREEIARRGQERCLREHSMEQRAQWLREIFDEGLRKPRHTPTATAPEKPKVDLVTEQLDEAEAHLIRGEILEAAEFLNMIVQDHPRNPRALKLLGQVAAAVGQKERADELFALARGLDGAPAPAPQPAKRVAPAASPAIPAVSLDPLSAVFPNVSFGHDVQCLGIGSTRIGRGSCLGDGTWINVCIRDNKPRMVLGECVLIGRRGVLSSGTHLEIGAFTIFAPNVYVASAEHQYQGNHLKPMMQTGIRDYGSLIIEENCWLGMNAVAVGAMTIGRGSVLGANAVLRDSLPPFSIAVGAPAHIVRMFNPVTEQWETVKSPEDRQRIDAARAQKPLPTRAEFLTLLRVANDGRVVPPIIAGRGEHTV